MVAQLVSEANEYFDAQREKSRRGYEKSTRRFRRLGMMPDQIAALCSPKLELSTVVCQVEAGDFKVSGDVFPVDCSEYPPLHAGADNGSREQKPAQFFLVEYFHKTETGTVNGHSFERGEWLVVQGPNFTAECAKDLIKVTQNEAKRNLGTRYRIRRNDGTRAVHRIAARKHKTSGAIELFAWST